MRVFRPKSRPAEGAVVPFFCTLMPFLDATRHSVFVKSRERTCLVRKIYLLEFVLPILKLSFRGREIWKNKQTSRKIQTKSRKQLRKRLLPRSWAKSELKSLEKKAVVCVFPLRASGVPSRRLWPPASRQWFPASRRGDLRRSEAI